MNTENSITAETFSRESFFLFARHLCQNARNCGQLDRAIAETYKKRADHYTATANMWETFINKDEPLQEEATTTVSLKRKLPTSKAKLPSNEQIRTKMNRCSIKVNAFVIARRLNAIFPAKESGSREGSFFFYLGLRPRLCPGVTETPSAWFKRLIELNTGFKKCYQIFVDVDSLTDEERMEAAEFLCFQKHPQITSFIGMPTDGSPIIMPNEEEQDNVKRQKLDYMDSKFEEELVKMREEEKQKEYEELQREAQTLLESATAVEALESENIRFDLTNINLADFDPQNQIIEPYYSPDVLNRIQQEHDQFSIKL